MFLSKPSFWIIFFVWLYLMMGLSILVQPPVISGMLVGADDYMRMVRVFDWLDGHRDYEFIQPRLGPEGGAGVAWSRIVDWPLIGLMMIFMPFYGRMKAAMMTATLFPALMLLAFIAALYWYARQTLPRRAAAFAPISLGLFLWGCATQFYPGRVDHHQWQLILLALSGGFFVRATKAPGDWRNGAAVGAFMALGFAIGAEIVPWVAAMAALFSMYWVYEGGAMRRAGLVYGKVLLLLTVLFMVLSRKPEFYTAVECDAISLSYVALAAAVACFWAGVNIVPARFLDCAVKRLFVAAFVAIPIAAGLLFFMPQCFSNPYGASEDLYNVWISRVFEARSALSFLFGDKPGVFLFYSGPYILAALCCLWAWWRERSERALWATFGILMAAALLLTFWQVRIAYIGQALTVLPLAWGLERLVFSVKDWCTANVCLSKPVRLSLELGFLILAAVLFVYTKPNEGETVAMRQKRGTTNAPICDYRAVSAVLNKNADKPLTIAAHISGGAELLFRTPDRVLAASYHRDAEGILAAHHLLAAGSEQAAHDLVQQYDVGAIVVCEEDLSYWQHIAPEGATPFAQRLWDGNVPSWLTVFVIGKGFKVFLTR